MLNNVTELNFLNGHAMTLMNLDALEAEMRALCVRCADIPSKIPSFDDVEWEEIMTDLLPCLPQESGTLEDLPLTKPRRMAIASQCLRVVQCIQEGKAHQGQGFSATPWCLVPQDYRARMMFVLGQAMLPFAWVMLADVLQFRPTFL